MAIMAFSAYAWNQFKELTILRLKSSFTNRNMKKAPDNGALISYIIFFSIFFQG